MCMTDKSSGRGWLWFLLFCILPIAVLLILPGESWSFGGLLLLAIFLVCPISMFFMMRMGDHGQPSSGSRRSRPGEPEGKPDNLPPRRPV